MSEPKSQARSPVRIIGSRELHQRLPAILQALEDPDARFVLTVHGKPRAVLVGAAPFLRLLRDHKGPSDTLVGLQLTALLGPEADGFPMDGIDEPQGPDQGD